jgi:hypothetical protein
MQTNHPNLAPASRDRRVAVHAVWFVGTLLLAQLTLLAGCAPNKRYDLIEAELRTRERELEETRAALQRALNLNRAYVQQQSANARAQGPHVPDPATPAFVPVKEIVLARGTGGVDDDGIPGDEGLMVVVAPQDEDGSAVKVPARVQILAWEVSDAGLKTQIGSWDVTAEMVRPTWRSGFISSGYFVAVPWQTYPGAEKVRVSVRLTTLDGRAFEADKDILVKLCSSPRAGAGPDSAAPGVPGRQPLFPDPLPPAMPPGLPPPIPPGAEELPPPSRTTERGARLLPPVSQ